MRLGVPAGTRWPSLGHGSSSEANGMRRRPGRGAVRGPIFPRVTEDDGAEGLPRTDGVVLVDALRSADAEAHWAGEDEEHARRFGWYPRRSSLERVRAFLLETEQQGRDGGPRRTFAIRDAATHTLLGGCEARLQGDATAHLSWWMFPPWPRAAFD